VQQRPDLEILQLRVGKVEGHLAKIGGKAGLVHSVVVPPVKQNLQHGLFVLAHEPGEQIDDLVAPCR
jgi:hypothetical protein